MLRTTGVSRNERQVHFRLLRAGELDLGFLRGLLEALQSHPVAPEVDTFLLLELVSEPVDDLLIEVIATQVGIAICGKHLEDTFGQI